MNPMSDLVEWLTSAPQGAIAFLTTVLAAVIAVLVSLLTQWILGRRARTELLTKKLEELYLALNEISAHNFKRVDEAPLASVLPFSNPKITSGLVERQGLELHKKIVMLVRFYFPKLSMVHQEVVQRNSKLNNLINRADSRAWHSTERLLAQMEDYRDAVVAMEEELIRNRRTLVKDYLFPVRYKHVAIQSTHFPSPNDEV